MSKSAHIKNIFLLAETFLQTKQLFSTTAIIASQDSKLMRNLGLGEKISPSKTCIWILISRNIVHFSEQSSLRHKHHTT